MLECEPASVVFKLWECQAGVFHCFYRTFPMVSFSHRDMMVVLIYSGMVMCLKLIFIDLR